jgi:hypothetical protein
MASKDVMIDIETLSTAGDALVLSIGARKFSCNDVDVELYEHVLLTPEPLTQILMGRRIDRQTQEWWAGQPADVAEHWLHPDKLVTVRGALIELMDFIHTCSGTAPLVWARGPHFDISILDSLYLAADIKAPWKYNLIRDVRTYVEGRVPVRCHNETRVDVLPAHHPIRDCDDQIRMLWQHGYNTPE